MKKWTVTVVALAALLGGCEHNGRNLAAKPASACPFTDWLVYKNTKIRKHSTARAYYYVTRHASVDADGAPKAYHPDDVNKPCTSHGTGLDCPANAGYPRHTWWRSVLVPDPDNPKKPYVQKTGPSKGYFVSATSLADGNRKRIDPARYVDATTVPYIVFPRRYYRLSGTGRLGDLGVAYNVKTGKLTPFIVAEIGPPNERLGESSIAFWEALGGTKPSPRDGSGVPGGETIFLVFPDSVKDRSVDWPISPTDLKTRAMARLARVGGTSVFRQCR